MDDANLAQFVRISQHGDQSADLSMLHEPRAYRKLSNGLIDPDMDCTYYNTLYIRDFPSNWFGVLSSKSEAKMKFALRKVFGTFGVVRDLAILKDSSHKIDQARRSRRRASIVNKIDMPKIMNNGSTRRGSAGNRRGSVTRKSSIVAIAEDSSAMILGLTDEKEAEPNLDEFMEQLAISPPMDPGFLNLYVQYTVDENIRNIVSEMAMHEVQLPSAFGSPMTSKLKVEIDQTGFFANKASRRRKSSLRRGQEKELVVRKAKFVEDQAGKLNLSNNVKQHMDSLDVVLDKLEKLSQEMPQGEDLKVVQTTMNNVSELVKTIRMRSVDDAANLIGESKALSKQANAIYRKFKKELYAQTTALPSIEDAFSFLGTSMFFECCRLKNADFSARTLFVPTDHAFMGNLNNFEDECWLAHSLPGCYRIADLASMSCGYHQLEKSSIILRVGLDISGSYVVWMDKDSYPPLKAKVIRSDYCCSKGTMVHVVDRIIFPM